MPGEYSTPGKIVQLQFVAIQESSSTKDAGSRGFYRASGILLYAEAVWLFFLQMRVCITRSWTEKEYYGS